MSVSALPGQTRTGEIG